MYDIPHHHHTHTGGGELARLAPVEASKYEDQY